MNFVTNIILAKFLGPEEFGRMIFLLITFSSLLSTTSFNSIQAFFTFISQKKRTKKIYKPFLVMADNSSNYFISCYYSYFTRKLYKFLWNEKNKLFLVFALATSFFQQNIWQVAVNMAEEQIEKLLKYKKLNALIAIIHCALIFLFSSKGLLILPYIFTFIIIEYAIGSLLAYRLYNPINDGGYEEDDKYLLKVFRKYWEFCKPFVVFNLVWFLVMFSERWMLNNWGGLKEQGFYGISEKFSSIILLFSTSILNIFWKETAEAFKEKNYKRLERIIEIYLK